MRKDWYRYAGYFIETKEQKRLSFAFLRSAQAINRNFLVWVRDYYVVAVRESHFYLSISVYVVAVYEST